MTAPLTELEAARRHAQRQLDKARAPLVAVEAAEAELAAIDEQIAAARQAEIEERRRQVEHQRMVADARYRYAEVSRELRDALRSIHTARLRLVSLGEVDPGDRVISPEAIIAPVLEAEQRANAIYRAALEQDRATPEQEAAYHERHVLAQQLHADGHPWTEAQQLASRVVDDGIPLEQALGADEEDYDDELPDDDEADVGE